MTRKLPEPLPKRVNLGCGYDIRPGFLNVDMVERHGPDLLADVSSLPMLPSGYFDEIVACDVLEHLERARTSIALTEWTRLLSPDGTIFIRVPSLFHLFFLLAAAEGKSAEHVAGVIHLMYGTQAYEGDYHLTGFTEATLKKQLMDVGLVASRVGLLDGWMFEIEASRNPPPTPADWPKPVFDVDLVELHALRFENRAMRRELDAVRQSTSWRLTAPLRAIKGFAGR